jgi:hypothetical protein
MKTYGAMYVYIHIFLISALIGGEWSASRPGCFTSGDRAPSTYCLGGRVGPRTSMDNVKRGKTLPLLGFRLWPLGCPAHSQSLYHLCYANYSNKGYRNHQFVSVTYMENHHTKLGHVVVVLVEVLCYKPEGHGFDSRWGHWIFQLT